MGKSIFIDQLKEGTRVNELFLVKSARLSETKAGKPYLILTVMDRSGELSGPVWENALQIEKICSPGEIVKVSGMVQSYRDSLQLKLTRFSQLKSHRWNSGITSPFRPEIVRKWQMNCRFSFALLKTRT